MLGMVIRSIRPSNPDRPATSFSTSAPLTARVTREVNNTALTVQSVGGPVQNVYPMRLLRIITVIVLATSVFSRYRLTAFRERWRARTVSYRASTARYPCMVRRNTQAVPRVLLLRGKRGTSLELDRGKAGQIQRTPG